MLVATLSACNGSAADAPIVARAPDPVVEVRRETVIVCPAEIYAPLPAAPVPGADAVVETNAPGRRWLAATLSRGDVIAGRLVDARAQCPPEQGERAE